MGGAFGAFAYKAAFNVERVEYALADKPPAQFERIV